MIRSRRDFLKIVAGVPAIGALMPKAIVGEDDAIAGETVRIVISSDSGRPGVFDMVASGPPTIRIPDGFVHVGITIDYKHNAWVGEDGKIILTPIGILAS